MLRTHRTGKKSPHPVDPILLIEHEASNVPATLRITMDRQDTMVHSPVAPPGEVTFEIQLLVRNEDVGLAKLLHVLRILLIAGVFGAHDRVGELSVIALTPDHLAVLEVLLLAFLGRLLFEWLFLRYICCPFNLIDDYTYSIMSTRRICNWDLEIILFFSETRFLRLGNRSTAL